MTPRWTRLACRDSRIDNAHVVSTLHRIYILNLVHACSRNLETAICSHARADCRGCMVRNKFRIKFRIIFQNIGIAFPVCSREHASSIFESIPASLMVAGRAFSLREGVRVHTFAKSPTSGCVRRCDYPAGIRVSKYKSILAVKIGISKFLIGTRICIVRIVDGIVCIRVRS